MKTNHKDSVFAQPIGIFGAGVSGIAVKQFIEAHGGEAVIYDENEFLRGNRQFTHEKAENHQLVINSPGFPPSHPWFKIAAEANCKVVGEIEFATNYWKGRTVFVTGTNGKSTITQLLTAVLKEAGYDAYAFGNIGIPFSDHHKFDVDEEAIAVIELSSFQSWNLQSSRVDGIIWSNFAEDHLDWHGEIVHYFDAKWNALCQVTDGPIVIGSGVLEHARNFKKTMPITAEIISDKLERIAIGGPISAVNKLNIEYVKRFVSYFDVEAAVVDKVVSHFAFLPHRLEFVGSSMGINYWNDSKATNFHAVEAALQSFYSPVVWLGGGLSKSGNISEFAQNIAPKIKTAITFGNVATALANALIEEGVLTYAVENMEAAMEILRYESAPGDEVVLSPGFASFDQFNGYDDRGTQFCDLIEKHFITPTEIIPTHVNN